MQGEHQGGSVHREEAVHPPRGSGAPPTVSVRAKQVDLLPAHERQRLTAFCSTTPTLYLPLASEGGLPFLRVLGWKGLSAIRSASIARDGGASGRPRILRCRRLTGRGRAATAEKGEDAGGESRSALPCAWRLWRRRRRPNASSVLIFARDPVVGRVDSVLCRRAVH